jgi:hypothetical protein
VPTHQPFDTATAASMTLRPQGGMHPRRPVSSLMAPGGGGYRAAGPSSPSSRRSGRDRANRNSRCATRRACGT